MKNKKELKPKGIFLKMDWDDLIVDLEIESCGKLLKNIYNFLHNRELIEMDKMEMIIYKHTIKPVIEYNLEMYYEKCAHNANISKKGVEAKKQKISNKILTQENPNGNVINPGNPKDKTKEIDKEIDKEILIEKNNVNEIINIKQEKEKLKLINDIDVKSWKNTKEKDFIIAVKELVKILGWNRFEYLIFSVDSENLAQILTEFDSLFCLESLQEVKSEYSIYIKSIKI